MKIQHVLAIVALMATGVSHASTPAVKVTQDAQDVQGCTVVAQVSATPPYFLPGGDVRQLKAQAAGLQADTLLITHRGLTSQGVAYKCQK